MRPRRQQQRDDGMVWRRAARGDGSLGSCAPNPGPAKQGKLKSRCGMWDAQIATSGAITSPHPARHCSAAYMAFEAPDVTTECNADPATKDFWLTGCTAGWACRLGARLEAQEASPHLQNLS